IRVSLNDDFKPGFAIFPNPAKHELFLTAKDKPSGYRLVDAMGRTLIQIPNENNLVIRVDCKDLPTGFYFVVDDAGLAQKLIIQ
ncbi:MAG: T9SS type A sorting domain-containing protein, partial [Bacteroidota bacterium]